MSGIPRTYFGTPSRVILPENNPSGPALRLCCTPYYPSPPASRRKTWHHAVIITASCYLASCKTTKRSVKASYQHHAKQRNEASRQKIVGGSFITTCIPRADLLGYPRKITLKGPLLSQSKTGALDWLGSAAAFVRGWCGMHTVLLSEGHTRPQATPRRHTAYCVNADDNPREKRNAPCDHRRQYKSCTEPRPSQRANCRQVLVEMTQQRPDCAAQTHRAKSHL